MTGSETSHARRAFAERLAGRPLLLDGAMGTLLFSRGIPQRASLDELVEPPPGHRVGVSTASTSQRAPTSSRPTPSAPTASAWRPYGLADRTTSSTGAPRSWRARPATSPGAMCWWRARSGRSRRPCTAPAGPDARRRCAGPGAGGGPARGRRGPPHDRDRQRPGPPAAAVEATRQLCDLPIVASMTFGEDLAAVDGTTPEAAARALAAAGVDALGVNCGAGPVACLDALGADGRGRRRACRC